jgi:hypothetical protein
MSKCLGLWRVLAVALMASPTAAFAGAWTLDAGQAGAVVTGTLSQADRGFDGNGHLVSIPRYSKDELQALLEYGVTNWFTVMLAPSLQHVAIAPPFEGQRSGLGYTDIGGRVRIWEADSWVVSGQTTFRIPGTSDQSNLAAIGYTDYEIDVRGLVGHSFKLGTWSSFVDVQVAQRFRLGGPPDEFRTDLTLGVRPEDKWLLLMQSFNVISEGVGTWGFPSFAYHKLQLSVVHELTASLSLQLGGYTTYAGRNALQENGLVLGAWIKF